jgi:hypothetical protein
MVLLGRSLRSDRTPERPHPQYEWSLELGGRGSRHPQDSSRLPGSFVRGQGMADRHRSSPRGQTPRRGAAFYLDESLHFLTLPGSIGHMLAEASSYRLPAVAAHQHLSHLPRELRAALFANAWDGISSPATSISAICRPAGR